MRSAQVRSLRHRHLPRHVDDSPETTALIDRLRFSDEMQLGLRRIPDALNRSQGLMELLGGCADAAVIIHFTVVA